MADIELTPKTGGRGTTAEKEKVNEYPADGIETLPPSYDDAAGLDDIQPGGRLPHIFTALQFSYDDPLPLGPDEDTINAPPWLTRNLLVAGILVCCFWALAPVLLAFASVIKGDLQYDPGDYTCDSDYIKDAALPWAGDTAFDAPGRYHSQCRLLYTDSLVIIVGGSFSLARAFMQIFAIDHKRVWRETEYTGRRSRLAWVYSVRAVLSVVPCVVYIAAAAILGTSPLLTGPAAAPGDDYVTMYTVCTALLSLAAVMHLYDSVCSGYMAVRRKKVSFG